MLKLKKLFFQKGILYAVKQLVKDQFDSSELLKRLEITEMTENFAKVTNYLTKLKETSLDYV